MANEDMRKASHIGLWIISLSVVVWIIYSATHTHNERNNFASGSASNSSDNHSIRWPFTIDINFSCVPKSVSDQWAVHPEKKPAEVKK